MKLFTLVKSLIALTFFLYFNPAHSVLVDISGVSVNSGTPVTATVPENEDFPNGLTMAFSFEIEHFGGSWLTDTKITVRNDWWYSISTTNEYMLFGSDCGFVSFQTGNALCDFEINIAQDAYGSWGDTWTFIFEDTFQDAPNPDYTFLANSYIGWGDDLEFVRNNHAVPEPSVLTLMGLGLLGFFAARRRPQ